MLGAFETFSGIFCTHDGFGKQEKKVGAEVLWAVREGSRRGVERRQITSKILGNTYRDIGGFWFSPSGFLMKGNELKQQEEGREQALGDRTGGKEILGVLISQTG